MLSSCRGITFFAVLLALIIMPGCGRKTALVPPQKLIPVAVNDLRYSLDETGVSLEWSYPVKMENGEMLTGIENFELHRAEVLKMDYCDGCPVRFDKQQLVDGGSLPATGEGRTATYKEDGLLAGYRYLYKVRSRGDWWFPSGDSNIVSFLWNTPPGVPSGLQVEPGDMKMTLSWESVSKNITGGYLEHDPEYQVYRKSGKTGFIATGEPVQGLQFVDTGLQNGTEYTYRARTLLAVEDTKQAGALSQEISGTPRDRMPPAQPMHLATVETPEGIKLIWQAVLADDLAGYRIYRRDERSTVPELIAEIGSDRNQYIDRNVEAGRKWFYSVTSFDKMQPPNESLAAKESVVDLH